MSAELADHLRWIADQTQEASNPDTVEIAGPLPPITQEAQALGLVTVKTYNDWMFDELHRVGLTADGWRKAGRKPQARSLWGRLFSRI